MRVCNRHQWGAISRAIVTGDARYLAEWLMAPLRITALLIIRQHCFTEKSWVKMLDVWKRRIFKIVACVCYFLNVSRMQRVCTKLMDINYSSGGRESEIPTIVLQYSVCFMHEKYHEQTRYIYIYIYIYTWCHSNHQFKHLCLISWL